MIAAVTGASGRLGNVLVRQLLEEGDEVRALVLASEPDPPSLRGLDVEVLRGDLRDRSVLRELVSGASCVYHLASKIDLRPDSDGSLWSVNVEGARLVAEATREAGARLVHCSSHHALERRPLDEPFDERRPLALVEACHYHRSKAHGELAVLQEVARGLHAVVVSPGTMIGPHDYEPSMIGAALLAICTGRLPVLLAAVSDYVDVRDVALAVVAAARRGRRGERYLLTGEVLPMRELARLLSEQTGRPAPRLCLPLWVGWGALPLASAVGAATGHGSPLTAGVLRAAVSPAVVCHDKAASELGFAPRSIAESLRDTVDWFREEGAL